MNHGNNPRRIQVDQLGFSGMVAAEFTQGGLLTSRQSAYFPAEDFRNSRIINEPTISFPNKRLPGLDDQAGKNRGYGGGSPSRS